MPNQLPPRDGPRVNEDIRVPQVRLIDQDGEMLGVMTAREALIRAYDVGLDLLEISPNAVPPVVKIEALTRSDGRIAVKLSDNGIGFEEKFADRIFVVFQRLHGRGEYEGSGIGLAIVRKIVERHGGTIKAKATLGEGAVFVFDLPGQTSQPLPKSIVDAEEVE